MGMYRDKINNGATVVMYDAETVDRILDKIESVVNNIIEEIENDDNYTKEEILDDLNRLSEDLY